MSICTPRTTARKIRPRSLCRAGAAFALSLLPLACCLGCDDEVSAEFRAAALDSIHQGFDAIAQGILDGVFAIAEPNQDSSSSTSNNSGSTSGTDTTTSGG